MNEGCTYKDQQYSEGSEVCQEGVVKKCRGGIWESTSRNCESSSIASWIRDLPIQSGDVSGGAIKAGAEDPSVSCRELTRYAIARTIVRKGNAIEFIGGLTPGAACTETRTNSIWVPIDDILEATEMRCTSGGSYVKIRFCAIGM